MGFLFSASSTFFGSLRKAALRSAFPDFFTVDKNASLVLFEMW